MVEFNNIFHGKTILVTGHTGFKGSWLCAWLIKLGANVIGYSLEPPTSINNFELLNLKDKMTDLRGDINDFSNILRIIKNYKPEIIFHLAAQAIVLDSYKTPRETIATNVLGTVNVLEAARQANSVKVIICITSDKCYENKDPHAKRECDPMGGSDPYSASKGMAEVAIASYRTSFPSETAIASVRAGNVIGGGDFANFRLVPDCIKALMSNKPIEIRNPASIRPWQHVLEPLSGYMSLASQLYTDKTLAEAFNFGQEPYDAIPAKELAEKIISFWGSGSIEFAQQSLGKEANILRLDWHKANSKLGWRPALTLDEALLKTADWFKAFSSKQDMHAFTLKQIQEYVDSAKRKGIFWANGS